MFGISRLEAHDSFLCNKSKLPERIFLKQCQLVSAIQNLKCYHLKFPQIKCLRSGYPEWHFNRLFLTYSEIELAWRQWQAPLCLMSLPISRPTAICYWLLPIIAHQNNTTLLGTKIKAAVHVCATQLSIKSPLHTDTCDLKETVENVMNLSRQMRRQYAALQYHNALEIWITTDTTGRSYEVWFHLSGLFYFVF